MIVLPALLYGSECWSLRAVEERKLEAFMNVLRAKVLGTPRYREKRPVPNQELVSGEKYLPALPRLLAIRRLSFYSRLFNPSGCALAREMLGLAPVGGVKIGAVKRQLWWSRVKRDSIWLGGGTKRGGKQLRKELRDLGARGRRAHRLLQRKAKSQQAIKTSPPILGSRPQLYQCVVANCYRMFGRRAELNRHVRDQHGHGRQSTEEEQTENQAWLACQESNCKRRFKRSGWLRRHVLRDHEGLDL